MKKEKTSFGVKMYNLWMEEQGDKLKFFEEMYEKNKAL